MLYLTVFKNVSKSAYVVTQGKDVFYEGTFTFKDEMLWDKTRRVN